MIKTEPMFVLGRDTITFDPRHTSTLVVPDLVLHDESELFMQPASGRVKHTITVDFDKALEAKFVGGSYISDATALSDPGFWVRDAASVHLSGRQPTPLAHLQATTGDLLSLSARPVGWMRGDTIVVCPTAQGDYTSFEERTIVRVQDRAVTINAPLTHQHPAVKLPDGTYAFAEVLHLERNIELNGNGAGGGHPHMHIQSTAKQEMNGVCWENFGVPRDDLVGRYPVHIHHCFDANRAATWSHLVVQQSGQRAFIPHVSHGITWDQCIAYDINREAYWWDPKATDETSETNDNHWQGCVAANVHSRRDGMAAFELRNGTGNAATRCTAVGVNGTGAASAFGWPTNANGTWGFDACVAHNGQSHPIYVWQNTGTDHIITNFTAYNNARSLLEGSYLNHYLFDGFTLVGQGIVQTAVSDTRGVLPLTYRNGVIDLRGQADSAVSFTPPESSFNDPTKDHRVIYDTVTMTGYRKTAIGFLVGAKTPNGPTARFTNCTVDDMKTLIYMPAWLHPETVIWWDDMQIVPATDPRPGTPHPEWNARVLVGQTP